MAQVSLYGRPVRLVLVACLVLAGISLTLPYAPTYDAWAWIVWGREVISLDLETTRGPSWKPLPVAFTSLFAPFGELDHDLPPALWLVIARAGALLGLVMAFRLARRLAGPGAPGIGAGMIATGALVLTPGWFGNMAHGNEAPMAVALMLWAIERHLDGGRGHAIGLGFLACLLRPEVFPFLAIYGAWLWRAAPDRRWLVAALAMALPALWLVPEWLGSGDPLGAAEQARSEPASSLSVRPRPWLAALERGHEIAGLPLELGALAAVILGWRRRGAGSRQRSEARIIGVFAAVVVGWVALVAAMTEVGFSGRPRYFLPAVVLTCVLAGVGGVRLVQVVPRRAAAIVVGLMLVAAVLPWAANRGEAVRDEAREAARATKLGDDLGRAVASAGGPRAVAGFSPSVARPFVTRLAWAAELPIRRVRRSPGQGLVFTASRSTLPTGRVIAHVGRWWVLAPASTGTRPSPVRGRAARAPKPPGSNSRQRSDPCRRSHGRGRRCRGAGSTVRGRRWRGSGARPANAAWPRPPP